MGLPQRAAPRYPVALRVAFSGAEVLLAEQVTNISAGGMFVRTERYLPIGTLVSVALELPDGAPPAPVRAKVVHVALPSRSRQGWSDTGIGVQFTASDKASRERVERYIGSVVQASRAPAVRLLSTARGLLQEKGWTQLTEKNVQGAYCLSGALLAAAGDDDDAYRAALQAVGPRLNVPACAQGGFRCHCAILGWNDRTGRTLQQVITKLDEAITAELARATATPGPSASSSPAAG